MILVVYGQKRYHEVLFETVKPGDVVIEIGPHIGGSTEAISARAGRVIAVDKSPQAEKAFKGKSGKVEFVKGDVRFFETVAAVQKLIKACDVLAVDMGGGRFPDTVFKVWSVWSGIFKPRDSVIRNRGLVEFLRRAQIKDFTAKTDFPDSGWLSQSGRDNPHQLKDGLDELRNWIV